uniref:Retrotransposon protein, putative, Ty3-gypsy subclass n=1 Tax=Oryza sativa subsp. japonica TaxID=39947 RepID=Q2R4P6_ORYSJ|nr:retrotransposon protein, putative, Ty3-gypsy subclass [Oryza sativa Japonica Group]
MYSDGSWSHKGAGISVILISPGGVLIRYTARLQFNTTNNTAEYEAVLMGLRKAKALGVRHLLIRTDTKLVASQVDKSLEAKEEGMRKYLEAVWSMEKSFAGIMVEHLPRGQNEVANALANSELRSTGWSPDSYTELLYYSPCFIVSLSPKEFITDNGKQFDFEKFKEMCEGLNLQIRFISVAHPQSNGVAKRANGKILEALKKRLEGAAKRKWPDEMLSILWALRTTPRRPTKFSPFMLLYGDEAMTPAELGANSARVMFSRGEDGREVSLELLEGVRVEALEHMRKYATGISVTYNKKVRSTELLPGHLVLWKKANPMAVRKLESKWEGPYLIKHRS